MAKRRKKRLRMSPPAANGAWANLPDELFIAILDRLPSIRDVYAFSAVCHTWRALARPSCSATARSSHPPLLLCFRSRARPRRYDLLCPATVGFSRRSLISALPCAREFIGFSHGHIILLAESHVKVVDVFTGTVALRLPMLPHSACHSYNVLLTAPISSPECKVLLVSGRSILLWHSGDQMWTTYTVESNDIMIEHLVFFEGKFFALVYGDMLFIVKLWPKISFEPLVVSWEEDWNWDRRNSTSFRQQLVQCGDDLMVIRRCFSRGSAHHMKFVVHRLELSSGLTTNYAKCVKVESLGNWALFLNYDGKSSVACARPGRWGGRSNCIYYAGPRCDTWFEFSLDDTVIDIGDPKSPFYHWRRPPPDWPSPIWVYPSAFYL